VRVFARLAWQAPDGHLGDLVDLAHSTWHDELALHRSLAAGLAAARFGAVPAAATAAYTGFLLDAAGDYGRGLAALLPCMWGYSRLGRLLGEDPAVEAGDARWVATYADPSLAYPPAPPPPPPPPAARRCSPTPTPPGSWPSRPRRRRSPRGCGTSSPSGRSD